MYFEELTSAIRTLKEGLAAVHHADSPLEQARLARVLRLETMVDIRGVCDSIEEIIPAELWTLATYKELLFLDSHTATTADNFFED